MPTASICAELIEAGVDWLTVTCSDRKRGTTLAHLSDRLLAEEARAGNDRVRCSFLGYDGFSCGSIQSGVSHDAILLRLKSHLASKHWRRAYKLSDNVSRIDLMSTFRVPRPVPDLLHKFEKQALTFRSKQNLEHDVYLHRSARKGITLNLNRRISDSFFRLYDKGAESKLREYENCLRIEGEFKKRRAAVVAATLLEHDADGPASAASLHLALGRKGLRYHVPDGPVSGFPVPRTRSDTDRRLDWLAGSVAGTIKRLRAEGRLRDAVVALGFSDEELLSLIKPPCEELKGG